MTEIGDLYLLKHIAVRSEVLNATVGGYRISISGLGRSTPITPLVDSLSLTYPTSTLKLQMMLRQSVINAEPLDPQNNLC